MAPPTKKASASAAASFIAGGEPWDDADDSEEINWLQNPHNNNNSNSNANNSNSTSTTSSDPALSPLLSQLSTLDSTLTCPICHATPLTIPVTLTPCLHTFCSLCLARNLRTQKTAKNGTTTSTSCPVCRTRCHEDRDVVPNPVLEEVCRLWRTVRGPVHDRMWLSSTSSSASTSSGDENGIAAAAKASSAASSAAASSTSMSAGGRKRPRRGSASRRAGGTATATAAAADHIDDEEEDLPSSDQDSGEEYAEGEEDGGSEDDCDSDTDDVEFVPKGGSSHKAPARSAAKAKVAKARSYPPDGEYLTSIRSTIDPHTLDRSKSLPGNLTHLKRPQLIRMLASYNLSTSTKQGGGGGSGGSDVLKERYRAFRMLYNAQCPSTRPAPIAQLVEQVHAEERARDRERTVAVMNGSGRVSEEMRRLNAKWTREEIDGRGGGGGGNGEEEGGSGGAANANAATTASRAADIPDKMKTGFAALLAEGKKRCKEQGWRMGEREEKDAGAGDGTASSSNKKRKWEEDGGQELGAQEEEKKEEDDADAADDGGAEEPIVLDDGSDEDEDDDRKPSAAEAARAAEDGINEPQDSTNDARNGDDDREAQISRSPSSESPRTVRASSSSDGLVDPTSASSAPASAQNSSSTKKAKKSKPSPRQAHQQTPKPQQYQPASVDTRSIRNNSTPSTIGPWPCGACTFYNEINIGSRDKCEVCETPRPRPSSRPSRNVASFDC